jgi:hypothetical protein
MNTTITHPELVTALVKSGQDIIDSLTPEKAHVWHMSTLQLNSLSDFAACG